MINLYIAPNGCGKTTRLEEIKNECKSHLCLFFPSGSEILSTIDGDSNKANGTKYDNNLFVIINKLLNIKVSMNDKDENSEIKINDSISKINAKLNELKNELFKDKAIVENKFNKEIFDFEYQIKDPITEIEFKNKTNKSDNIRVSTGETAYYHIIVIFSLLRKYIQLNTDSKITIIFDEPESYMHPEFINNVVDEIDKFSSNNNVIFHIASHNQYLISKLLNESQNIKVFYRLKSDKNPNNTIEFKEIQNINPNYFYSSSQILYDVYKVPSIEFFFELFAKLIKCHLIEYNEADETALKPGLELLPTPTPHTNNGFTHRTKVCFVRNYYSHPENRQSFDDFINRYNLDIKVLLTESINNAINVLQNNYSKLG